jgi:phospholipid/cholesterol/gamma-HCH transport system substrate-binding protein
MLAKKYVEFFVGSFIIAFCSYFFVSSYNKSGLKKTENGYEINAKFNNIDGINIGSEVRISGIKIGEVIAKSIEPNTYKAVITLNVDNKIKIPSDSNAQISSEGFLGGKFVNISAGADDDFIEPKGYIQYTQSSLSLENLIGKMVFSKEENKTPASNNVKQSQ